MIRVEGDGLNGGDPADRCEGISVQGREKDSRRLAVLYRVLKMAESEPEILDRLADVAFRIECETLALAQPPIAV